MLSFGVAKFKSLLLAGSVGVAVNFAMDLVNSMVAGHLVGADALSAVNLAAPLISAAGFLAGLVSTGVATNYSFEMGRLDRQHARRYFTQGVWMSLGFGGALSLAIALGGGAFIDFLGPSEAVARSAAGYLRWAVPIPVTYCLEMLLMLIVCADGDSRFCSLAYGCALVVDMTVSVTGARLGLGAAGCALGMLASQLSGIAILAIHFFQKTNTVSMTKSFSLGDTWRISVASFGDAASFLCEAALFLFINKFVIWRFGAECLPVAAVVITLWGALELYNGIAIALQPIVSVYFGEGNTPAIRTVMRYALRLSLAEGAVFALVLAAFPSAVVRLVGGLDDPALVAAAAPAVRMLSVAFLAQAVAGLFNSYYMFVARPFLASVITFAAYLVMPVLGLSLGAMLGGFNGMWAGFAMAPVAALAAVGAGLLIRYGRSHFPLLLSREREGRVMVFNLPLEEREIVRVSQEIAKLEGVPMRASLMVEEVLMVVRERANGRRLLGEVTVDLNDGVQLTLRDDGEIFDITDTDGAISSLRSFVVASVMERQRSRFNLVTTGFNRNVFRF